MKYQPKVAITLNKSISPILHRNTTGIKLNKIFKMKFKFYEVDRVSRSTFVALSSSSWEWNDRAKMFGLVLPLIAVINHNVRPVECSYYYRTCILYVQLIFLVFNLQIYTYHNISDFKFHELCNFYGTSST